MFKQMTIKTQINFDEQQDFDFLRRIMNVPYPGIEGERPEIMQMTFPGELIEPYYITEVRVAYSGLLDPLTNKIRSAEVELSLLHTSQVQENDDESDYEECLC
jgi:hypothetical protein